MAQCVPRLDDVWLRAEQKEANELVAEFMLLANMSVAQLIGMAFPDKAMLRRHPTPEERKMGELEAAAQKLVRLRLHAPAPPLVSCMGLVLASCKRCWLAGVNSPQPDSWTGKEAG